MKKKNNREARVKNLLQELRILGVNKLRLGRHTEIRGNIVHHIPTWRHRRISAWCNNKLMLTDMSNYSIDWLKTNLNVISICPLCLSHFINVYKKLQDMRERIKFATAKRNYQYPDKIIKEVIWFVQKGYSDREISQMTSVPERTIRRWKKKYL